MKDIEEKLNNIFDAKLERINTRLRYLRTRIEILESEDTPDIQPTGSDIVRELLKEGKPVLCFTGYSETETRITEQLKIICEWDAENTIFFDVSGDHFNYAIPSDTSEFASYVPETKE